ncbi:MAG: hypothetical protein RI894_1967, partial [Bacteroidota bacterium]
MLHAWCYILLGGGNGRICVVYGFWCHFFT